MKNKYFSSPVKFIFVFCIFVVIISLFSVLYTLSNHLENQNVINLFIGVMHQSGIQPALTGIKPITGYDHILNNNHAKITIVEFTDFECPQCQYFQPTIRAIIQKYGNRIRYVYRSFPLPQHQNAEQEAEAAECVGKLGGNNAFWNFYSTLFSQMQPSDNGTGFSLMRLPVLAQSVGIDKRAFQKCLYSRSFYSRIQAQIADGNHGGISQLPSTFIIDSTGYTLLISGNQPFPILKIIIDHALLNT